MIYSQAIIGNGGRCGSSVAKPRETELASMVQSIVFNTISMEFYPVIEIKEGKVLRTYELEW
jgi:hypothetical protein